MRLWAVCMVFVRMLGMRMRLMGVAGVRMPLMGVRVFRIGRGQIKRRTVMRTIRRNDIHFGGGNSAAHHLAYFKTSAHLESGCGLLKQGKRNACVDQRAEQHVPADTGKAFQIANSHRD